MDVLRKYGPTGVYGLVLRKEFMAAADLLVSSNVRSAQKVVYSLFRISMRYFCYNLFIVLVSFFVSV